MKNTSLIKPKKVSIDFVKPYVNNPRLNTEAVEAVKASILKYGYRQPILVDKKGVIIVGHTRYEAIKQLGWTEIYVVISDMDDLTAAKYRLADNKVREKTSWDMDKLTQEFRETGGDALTEFFKGWNFDSLLREDVGIGSRDVTDKDVTSKSKQLENSLDAFENKYEEVICPKCGKKLRITK